MRDPCAIVVMACLLSACWGRWTEPTPTAVCAPAAAAKAGTPLTWNVETSYQCGSTYTCEVSATDHTLDLRVVEYDSVGGPFWDEDCAILAFQQTPCDLPPLSGGTRLVRVNGLPVTDIEFNDGGVTFCSFRAIGLPERVAACVPSSVPANTSFSIRSRFKPKIRGLVCIEDVRCVATIAGNEIAVSHTAFGQAEGCLNLVSPDPLEVTCEIPPLVSGTYALSIDGERVGGVVRVGGGSDVDCTLP